MNRIKRGSTAIKWRTKGRLFTSSCRGAHSNLIRIILQKRIKAMVSSRRDRDKKKKGLSQFVDQSNKCNNRPE